MRSGLVCRVAVVAVVASASLVASTRATALGGAQSPTMFVRSLAAKPIGTALPPGFVAVAASVGYLRTHYQHAPQPPPRAVGMVEVGVVCPCLEHARIRYTIYPSAAIARSWMLGDGAKPAYSIWRLKQLNAVSLPHPRISGTVPGYRASVIVESSGGKRYFTRGVTEMNVLSGNVIVNVAIGSHASTQHGNRVAARRLLDAAVAHLRAARRS